MTGGSDALDEAKRLYGVVVRLAAKRERRVLKATGDFQIDLLEAIRDEPDAILDIVERAVRHDPGQSHLQLALAIAIDERRREHADAETESPPPNTLDVTGPSLRSPAPARFEIEGDAGALDELESPMESDDAPAFGEAFERLAQPGRPGRDDAISLHDGREFRYPEPGEPATQLPDGTVVAAMGDQTA